MLLHILRGQRNEGYEGEFAPEALSVMDEYGNEENPAYLVDAKKKHEASGEFESVVVVTLKVNGAAVMDMLRPAKRAPLTATIESSPA